MVTVSVSDSQTRPGTATRTLSLRVASVAPPPLSITTDSLPGGTAGSSYNAVLEASGGISPYGWSASGLPAGLALSTNTGQISGTPSTAGSYTVSASVRDSESSPAAASKTLSLNVASAAVLPLSITTTSLAAGTAGSSYSTALQASGGVTPYSWTVTGLPAGLSLNGGTGQIVGTPSTAGAYAVTASVRDSEASPASASKTFTLSIASTALPPVSIITTSLPSATAGSSYNIMLQASGGVMPYVWSIGTGQLPLGLSLNASTGVISGTPSASGSYGFTAAVKDSESTPQTASQSLQLTVSPPAPTPQPGVNWSTNPSLGPQFYVSPSGSDTNDGSAAHPWLSLSRADSAARPGATIHVLPGTYPSNNENGARLLTTTSGTAAAPIRWVSDQRWSAKLTSTQTGNSATWWNQGNYVEIQGFDLSGSGALGIYNEGSFTRIIGNHVHNIQAPGCPSDGGAGIHDGNYSASDDDIIGNWVHDIGDYNSPCPRVHGIYHANLRGHLYNNVVYRAEGWGIHTWHAANKVAIVDNTVFNNAYGGILIGGQSSDFPGGSGVQDNSTINNNLVFRNGLVSGAQGYGIEEYGDVGTHNTYVNNLVSGNGPADWNLMGGTQSGTITADPLFNSYTGDGNGDYHLQSASPAIARGTSTAAPWNDLDRGPRPINGTWSLGAYQYGSSVGAYPEP